ncbi:hypothetical protein HN51_040853 [Arachis hypogaea]
MPRRMDKRKGPSLSFFNRSDQDKSQVRRNGTNGESSAVHTWAKTTDFVWKRNTNRFPLFRVLIERSEIKVYYKVSEVSMVFYLCVVSVHSGRLRTDASLLLN